MSNKRRQSSPYVKANKENSLLRLCRTGDWKAAMDRCVSHPDEAKPILTEDHSLKRSTAIGFDYDSESKIYLDTPLGLACASDQVDSEQLFAAIVVLLKAWPAQVMSSQLVDGHTPLRDLVRNPKRTPRLLKLLLEADTNCCGQDETLKSSLSMTDRDGFLPIDHIIVSVQLNSDHEAVNLLKIILPRYMAVRKLEDKSFASPLIRLLTMGTSMDVNNIHGTSGIHRIHAATKLLLKTDPSLLFQHSSMTGCSPLHVALRNYGDYLPLAKEVLDFEGAAELLEHANDFGDLPIHVACSVGVPLEVLQLIIERTLSSRTGSLLMTANKSGYTPIDLEWVRHIECGNDFLSLRSFYPLEPNGVRKYCFKQDQFYQNLLREAVDQIIHSSSEERSSLARGKNAQHVLGRSIDRLELLVEGSAANSIGDFRRKPTLHSLCKLVSPTGSTLPLPLLELFLWVHSDELLQKDYAQCLPLHYALTIAKGWERQSSGRNKRVPGSGIGYAETGGSFSRRCRSTRYVNEALSLHVGSIRPMVYASGVIPVT